VLPDGKEIRGFFTIVDLDGKDHAEYEALSYAWGDPTPVTHAKFDEHDLTIGIAQT